MLYVKFLKINNLTLRFYRLSLGKVNFNKANHHSYKFQYLKEIHTNK